MKIAIVGAGIMGRLLAFTFCNAGYRIVLFDQDSDDGNKSCSMAAAGLLTPVSELERSDLLVCHMGQESIHNHWQTIIDQLDPALYFRKSGSLVVSHPRDKAELLRFMACIEKKIGAHHYQKLQPSTLQQLEPEMTKFEHAYYFPNEAHLDNQAIFTKLADYLRQHQVAWHTHTFVDEVRPYQVRVGGTQMRFDKVFDCRGLGAKSAFGKLQGIRGELLWLHAPDVHLHRPVRFLHPRYSLYVVPREHNLYLVGASEIHAEDTSPISVRSMLELLTAAYYLHAGFAEARIQKTVTHCRPVLPNYLPAIRYRDGLIAINGLYRHGFLLAPLLAAEIRRYTEQGITALSYPQLWRSDDD
ncbi:FAD-dependent oxidoreductase [Aquicella lusitana]|uniref:Glycine oxidase n=1 Tax=Aquicella lusitana TaxID=254246 RepID=A0A370GGU8_9COXI|nr:FAD-dependent oxidoreductase [Aquicella lusitana]RDI42560.1 glycine oxidase [Aquicella lusitana]VVC74339.1 tRNA 5-methylaminomethyl-2-thiouridine biosynthesis bifunctional protein MnmC [Aquicella lusitana]